jgi:hypothetical protein
VYNQVLGPDPTKMMEVGMDGKRVIGVDIGKRCPCLRGQALISHCGALTSPWQLRLVQARPSSNWGLRQVRRGMR